MLQSQRTDTRYTRDNEIGDGFDKWARKSEAQLGAAMAATAPGGRLPPSPPEPVSVFHVNASKQAAARRQSIIEYLRDNGPSTRQQIADALGAVPSTVSNDVTFLQADGAIVRAGHKKWAAADKG